MRKFSLLDSLRRRDWREPESVYWPLNEDINDRLKKRKRKREDHFESCEKRPYWFGEAQEMFAWKQNSDLQRILSYQYTMRALFSNMVATTSRDKWI